MVFERLRDEVIDVAAAIDLAATPGEVWALIEPPETAMLLDPQVVKAFRVPGTPEEIGEMQGYISHRDGREQVHLVEVVEEVPERWALIRIVGGTDEAARTGYRLTQIPGTRLEQLLSVTVPASQLKVINQDPPAVFSGSTSVSRSNQGPGRTTRTPLIQPPRMIRKHQP